MKTSVTELEGGKREKEKEEAVQPGGHCERTPTRLLMCCPGERKRHQAQEWLGKKPEFSKIGLCSPLPLLS